MDLLQNLAAVSGLAHHLEIVFQLEELLQPVANNRMIVREQDPHRGLLLFRGLRAVVDGFAYSFHMAPSCCFRPDDKGYWYS